MSHDPFSPEYARRTAPGPRGKPLFVLGAVLLIGAIGSLVAATVLLANAGHNAEPGAPGLIPGQTQVLGPVAALIAVGFVSFMGAIFSLMIGAKRLMRTSGEQGEGDEAGRAAA
jgi:hypothetical protein